MRLDVHVHTYPGSRCAAMSTAQYLEAAAILGLSAACITNHGNMDDFDRLAAAAPDSLTVIPGVEISSAEGDFLIFSSDLGFLRSLEAVQELPAPGARPGGTAVVWAHPFAGIPGGAAAGGDHIGFVASQVDGIEVFNGNWPDLMASAAARRIAEDYGLAELGGSDAHRRESLYSCWTEVGEVNGPADLVEAIRARATLAAGRGQAV